ADPLPAGDRPEVLPFLLFRPVPEQTLAHESVAHRRDDAGACVSPREFLDRDRIAHGVEAGPSVFLRHEDAEEPELAHLLRPRVRELLALVEGAGLRDDLLL